MEINLLLIALLLLTCYKLVRGYKNGIVKEVISLISLLLLCAVAALVANGIQSYQKGHFLNVVVAVVLLVVLSIVHHLLSLVFFSAKLVAELPVIHYVNQLLGAVFGMCEGVLFLWLVYVLNDMLDMGSAGELIRSCTEQSAILTWLHENNWLAYGLQQLLALLPF